MKPDRFDILVLSAVAVLTLAALVLGQGGDDGRIPRAAAARKAAEPPDPAVYQELKQAETLMEAGQPREAVESLKRLSASHPTMSEPHALMGQAYARMLDYPPALREYRTALVMDPDYVDKKSGKFIGKRIKAAVKDGMAEARKAVAADASNAGAKAELKDAYYLERMLAGGCE